MIASAYHGTRMQTDDLIGNWFPDPVLSASLYAAGRLDALMAQVVVPLRDALDGLAQGVPSGLWLVRYGRAGEHLKLRLHVPDAVVQELRAELARRMTAWAASQDSAGEAVPRPYWEAAPVVDDEDEADHHTDLTLAWTAYRRSPLSLGDEPLLRDDCYCALLTRCLAAACDELLSLYRAPEPPPLAHRRGLLQQILLTALPHLAGSREEVAAYLAYHRDWLLRAAGARARKHPQELLGRLRIPSTEIAIERLRQPAAANLPSAAAPTCFLAAALALRDHAEKLCRRPGHSFDPYAHPPVHACIFKIFHGAANQAGLDLLNEALTHDLLLRALAGDGGRAAMVQLLPALAEDEG